ncbi:MAG: DUF4127 family protein, partial [bacterium]|nr:DUF4127 family protein [bacterium]
MAIPKSILLLPLDSRPCCLVFPQRIAAIAGCRIIVPPRRMLGNLTELASRRSLMRWYRETLQKEHPCACIASLDLVSWGGLVGSRKPCAKDRSLAAGNTSVLFRFPGRLLAFGSVMRPAPTQKTAQEVELAGKIIGISEKMGSWLEKGGELPEGLASLMAEVPESYLKDYLSRRLLRHRANMDAARAWEKRGGNGKLVFGMDDSKTEGLNVCEARQLRLALARLPGAGISTGLDEMAMLLMASALGGSEISLEWPHPEAPGLTGAYEDAPFAEVVRSQCQTADITISVNAKRRLFLYAPPASPQREACRQQAEPLPKEYLDSFLDKAEAALASGCQVAIADIAWANGSDRRLAEGLIKRG